MNPRRLAAPAIVLTLALVSGILGCAQPPAGTSTSAAVALASSAATFQQKADEAAAKACMATQRMLVTATELYVLEDEPSKLPSDWNGLMKVLVPAILKKAPSCMSGGTYSIDTSSRTLKVTCSVHGRAPETTSTPAP